MSLWSARIKDMVRPAVLYYFVYYTRVVYHDQVGTFGLWEPTLQLYP